MMQISPQISKYVNDTSTCGILDWFTTAPDYCTRNIFIQMPLANYKYVQHAVII